MIKFSLVKLCLFLNISLKKSYKMRIKNWNKLSIFTIFFYLPIICYTQVNNGCLSKSRLIKMQNSSLQETLLFLYNDSWFFDGAASKQNYMNYDFPIDYDIVSWKKSSYYNGGQLYLYSSKDKPNIVIYNTNSFCFNSLLKTLNTSKIKTIVKDNDLLTTYKEGSITFELTEYKDNHSNQQYTVSVLNTNALLKEIQTQKDKEVARKKIEDEKKKKYQEAIEVGDLLFFEKKFDEAKLKYISAKNIENNTQIEQKINNCNNSICERLISTGDSLLNSIQYDSAMIQYKNAVNCTNNLELLNQKIKTLENKILKNKINSHLNKANLYYSENKYDLALEEYYSILKIDNFYVHAITKIEEINKLKNILTKRKTSIFSYKSMNNDAFNKFQIFLIDDLNKKIKNSNNGYLNLSLDIKFDTIGSNLSEINKCSTSIKGYSSFLSENLQNGILTPTSISNYRLSSKENLNFNLNWNTKKVKCKLNYYGSNNLNLNEETVQYKIVDFLKSQKNGAGKYIFKIKEKEFNGNVFTDISLVKYKTVGPLASIYSILLPGIGTLKVSYGNKGWGRLTCFILSTGLAIGSKLNSVEKYKSYLRATTQEDIEKYYNHANITNQIALISGSISASIYLYDIIWVISKGFKNKSDSKQIRKKLKLEPLNIQNQPLSWN